MGDLEGHNMEIGYYGHSLNSHVVNKHGSHSYTHTNNYERKSDRNPTLLLLVIALAVLCFGLGAYIVVTGPLAHLLIKESSDFIGICDSPECVEISHRSIKSGNFAKNPCEDFYAFACSKWQQHNPTSQDQLYSATNINQIKDGVDFYIKRLLEKPEEMGVNGTTSFHMHSSPKAFYESCLHFKQPEDSHIISELISPLGGYKTEGNWDESDFDLTTAILMFLRVNAAPLFDLTLDIDPKDRSKYALIVELPRVTSLVPNLFQPLSRQDDVLINDKLNFELTEASSNGFNLNTSGIEFMNTSDFYPSTVDRSVLYKMITDNVEVKRIEKLQIVTEQIGKLLNLSNDEIENDVKSISVFATNIEKVKPSHRSRKFWKQQNKVYNAFKIESLQRLFSNIDWRSFFERLLGHRQDGKGRKSEVANFSWENATIYVPYPEYLRRLSQAIQFTDKRTVLNGMLVMYVKDMLNDIAPKKKENDEQRWKFCVHSTKSVFAMEISSLYMRSYEPSYLQAVKQDVDEIFTNIKETLEEYLKQSHWQNNISREESLKKVHTLKGNFIGPDFYLKPDYLEDRIKNEIKVQIDPKNFLGNVLLVYKIFRKQLYALYLEPINEDRAIWSFVTFPTTVNAFYIQQFNSIVVPLAFLNPPHYIYGAPKYINYATIALTIAHEALHSLDSSGSDFNSEGKLSSEPTQQSGGLLKEKSACVSKQYYENFRQIVPFHHSHVNMFFQIDGNLTQNENLADIAGLQVAWKAYQKYFSNSISELEKRKLPALKFTRNQMYFLSVAQGFCANITPMGYIFLLEMDEHSPHPERMNGLLMNIPDFATAFGCPTGSRMNPSVRCHLW